jgi:hypothetical protein
MQEEKHGGENKGRQPEGIEREASQGKGFSYRKND